MGTIHLKKYFAILGAAGYIGTHLSQYFHFKYGDNCEVLHVDIATKEQMRFRTMKSLESIKGDFDAVFHLAATSDVGSGYGSPYSLLENNLSVTMEAIQYFKGRTRAFVFASSSAVYQEVDGPLNEKDSLKQIRVGLGNDTYADSKILCEKVLKTAQHEFGLKYMALRLGNVAGYDFNVTKRPEFQRHLIPKLLNWNNKDMFQFYGNPVAYTRDYVHVGDVCRAFDLAHIALLNERDLPEAVNIGTGIGTTNWDILQKVNNRRNQLTIPAVNIEVVNPRHGEPKKIILDPQLADIHLNWQPEKNLEEIVDSL